MTKIQSQKPRPAVQTSSAPSAAAAAKPLPAAAKAPPAPDSSFAAPKKKPVNFTGRHKASPIPLAAKPDLAAEVMARRSFANSAGTGKAAASAPMQIAKGAGGEVTITGSAGNDTIRVEPRKDGKPGVDVVSGKQRITLDDAEAKKLTVNAAAGNDQILVDPKVAYDLTLKGGSGDDLIRGGSGADRIEGSAGRDMIYGGDGDDTLLGGDDADMIQGNAGNDKIGGGKGDDALLGGAGNDTLGGGEGKNVVSGGAGKNTYAQGAGNDTVYNEKGDTFRREKDTTGGSVKKVEVATEGSKPAGHTIAIQGSPQFKAKVEAELEALRGTPTGRAMLADIDAHPDKPIVIKEAASSQAKPTSEADSMVKGAVVQGVTGTGKGSGSTVTWNADQHRLGGLEHDTAPADADDAMTMAPTIALFHELVHAHRSQLGESDGLVKREEFETAGTKDDPTDPNKRYDWKYTENKLRAELGMPDRTHYDD